MVKYLTDDPAFDIKATEIARAFIKQSPELCAMFLAQEREDLPISDELSNAMLAFIRDTGRIATLHEATTVIRKIRRLVREDGGLSVRPDSRY